MASDNVDEIKEKSATLAQVAMKLGEALYGSQPGAGPEAGPGDAAQASDKQSSAGDTVVDADFEEVKDDKKKSA
jgi:molecular chaperone DnaK